MLLRFHRTDSIERRLCPVVFGQVATQPCVTIGAERVRRSESLIKPGREMRIRQHHLVLRFFTLALVARVNFVLRMRVSPLKRRTKGGRVVGGQLFLCSGYDASHLIGRSLSLSALVPRNGHIPPVTARRFFLKL